MPAGSNQELDPLQHLQDLLLNAAYRLKTVKETGIIYPRPEVSTTTYVFDRRSTTIGDADSIKSTICRLRHRLIIQNLKVLKWKVETSEANLIISITSGKASGPFSRWITGVNSTTKRTRIEYGLTPSKEVPVHYEDNQE
jgi:hypothetical protein